jgi:epoxyqueuosine reductase
MGMAVEALTGAVKAEARRLGFELVGVTTPDPPPHLQIYEKWLEVGRNASMTYLAGPAARARRADPRLILPECQSILVLGARYPAPPPTLNERLERETGRRKQGEENNEAELGGAGEGPRGRIASYAWGDDYHLILPERLREIVAFVEQQIGHRVSHRVYTDTGPILERDLAQRAGLGWIGKNTCLINPNHGSYFLLAEILLEVALEIDPPFLSDHCGTCTRCVDACPTDCILPDRTLDAGRCISYLTIENKGEIPPQLRPLVGDWIFGCDICQAVCPWNLRFATRGGDAAFSSREGIPLPILADELGLSQQEFSSKFRNSAVKRSKRRGYLRNVAVALGNRGTREDIHALKAALVDEDDLVREHARWAVDQIEARQADHV